MPLSLVTAVLACGVLFFMLYELAVQFVHQLVYRGIHVFGVCVGKQLSARDVRGSLGEVAQRFLFFHVQYHVYLRYLVAVAVQFFELLLDVAVYGIGQFNMMPRYAQLHRSSSCDLWCGCGRRSQALCVARLG